MNATSAAAMTTTTPLMTQRIFERGPVASARTARAPVAAASFGRPVSPATRLPPLLHGCDRLAFRRHSTHLLRSTFSSRQRRSRIAEVGDRLDDLLGVGAGGVQPHGGPRSFQLGV